MLNPIKNNLIIELHVPDLNLAKDFYSKLGFEISLDDKLNDKNLGYLTMTREDELGNTMLNFYGGDERVYGQSFFKQFPPDTKRGYAVSITITTKDIEQIYKLAVKSLKENIVRDLKEIEDHGHKWKDFRLVDPFGYYLRFTELVDWGQKF
jgi:predicted lactoylglutathione lyase